MRLGSHVSAAGKIFLSLTRAKSIGCETMQIFSGSPHGWKPATYESEDIAEFRSRRQKLNIDPIAIHLPYLVNLGSSDQLGTRRRSIDMVFSNLEHAKLLGADYLVVHTGSHLGAGVQAGITAVIGFLKEIFTADFGQVKLLLENTAGSGHALGSKMEEIAAIIGGCGGDRRLGVCLDTCHAYAAGYDVAGADGLESLLDLIDDLFGLDRLRFFHLNDSRGLLGSRLDRHEQVGKGHIGLEGFRYLVSNKRLANLAGVIETPRASDIDDRRNVALLKRLAVKEAS